MYEKTPFGFPAIISLFSAPEYFPYKNDAAIMVYHEKSVVIKKVYHTAHPYYLPHFENVFSWSLPFVSMKISEILICLLKMHCDLDFEKEEEKMKEDQLKARNRVLLLAKLLHGYKAQKEERERELIAQAMNISRQAQTTSSYTILSPIQMKHQIALGNEKEIDQQNEAFPAVQFPGHSVSLSKIERKRKIIDSKEKISNTKSNVLPKMTKLKKPADSCPSNIQVYLQNKVT